MGRIWFVTGTDTGVGKTVVSSLLVAGLRSLGRKALGVKPLETGCIEQEGLPVGRDGLLLAEASGRPGEDVGLYRFYPPVGPTVAAAPSGGIILERTEAWVRTQARLCDHLVVEGVGGLMVPLRGKETVLDLIKRLAPEGVVLVSRNRLGALSQVISANWILQKSRIPVLGVILTPEEGEPSLASETNARELAPFVFPVLHCPSVDMKAPHTWGAIGRQLVAGLESVG